MFNIKCSVKELIRKNLVVLFIIAAVIIMSIVSPYFFSSRNFRNILNQISIEGIVALAMTFAIICGEFDLSVSTTFALSSVIYVMALERTGVFPAVLLALLYGLVIGSFNGLLVAKLKINSFIVTLGTNLLSFGIALTMTQGETLKTIHPGVVAFGEAKFGGLTVFFFIFLLMAVFGQWVLSRTKFGRNIYATGGNAVVAKLSGINTDFYKFIIFVFLGIAASLAGVLLASRLASAAPGYGANLALSAVSVVVIGGASLSGGKGSITKTVLGLVFIGILFNGFNLVNIQAYIQQGTKGLIVVIVIMLDHYSRRIRAYNCEG